MHPETSRAANGSDRGTVVIEAAMVVPVLLAVTVMLVWVASLGATYVRLLDVAQTAARQVARGVTSLESPSGVDLAVADVDGLIRAQASERVTPPLLGFVDWGMTVTAEAHAVPEWGIVDSDEGAW